MIIPPIHTKGKFTFDGPFNALLDDQQEYKVVSIRSLLELHNAEEEPCDSIYKAVGLTESEFKEDLDNNIPVIVLTNSGGEYIHLPGRYMKSMPDVSGIKYRGTILAINLGLLPLDYDLTLVKEVVIDDVLSVCGITSTIEAVPSTAITLLSHEADITYKQTRDTAKTVNSSYKTRYLLLKELHDKKVKMYDELSTCVQNKLAAP